MRRKGGLAILFALAVAATPAEGGHEMPVYPSFYPHEIKIETIDPAAAAHDLPNGQIHAYIGGAPDFTAAPPSSLAAVQSLGDFVVVSVDPPDCAALGRALREVAEHPEGIVFHPYPVTPYHADYLEQADLAERAKARARTVPSGHVAHKIERIDASALLAQARAAFDGWAGPPWLKTGWFAAYRLLAGGLAAPERQRAAALLRKLEVGGFDDLTEQYAAERALVSLLTGNCGRAVAGYTVRREWYDADFSTGIENIAADAQEGLDSAVFVRTVKLKDFPWNGWLRLGLATRPEAAWNPAAGFTDPAGRLIWAALGDPAAFPMPYGDGWSLARIADVTRLR